MTLRLVVMGIAVPQGSMRAFLPRGHKHPIVTSDNQRLRPWRQSVIDATVEKLAGLAPLECPVELALTFYLPRPKSAPRRIAEPGTRPDLDKCVRACADALTSAGVWRDDAQVVAIFTRKAYAGGLRDPHGPAGVPRAVIEVREAIAQKDLVHRSLFVEADAWAEA